MQEDGGRGSSGTLMAIRREAGVHRVHVEDVIGHALVGQAVEVGGRVEAAPAATLSPKKKVKRKFDIYIYLHSKSVTIPCRLRRRRAVPGWGFVGRGGVCSRHAVGSRRPLAASWQE